MDHECGLPFARSRVSPTSTARSCGLASACTPSVRDFRRGRHPWSANFAQGKAPATRASPTTASAAASLLRSPSPAPSPAPMPPGRPRWATASKAPSTPPSRPTLLQRRPGRGSSRSRGSKRSSARQQTATPRTSRPRPGASCSAWEDLRLGFSPRSAGPTARPKAFSYWRGGRRGHSTRSPRRRRKKRRSCWESSCARLPSARNSSGSAIGRRRWSKCWVRSTRGRAPKRWQAQRRRSSAASSMPTAASSPASAEPSAKSSASTRRSRTTTPGSGRSSPTSTSLGSGSTPSRGTASSPTCATSPPTAHPATSGPPSPRASAASSGRGWARPMLPSASCRWPRAGRTHSRMPMAPSSSASAGRSRWPCASPRPEKRPSGAPAALPRRTGSSHASPAPSRSRRFAPCC